MKKIEGRIVKAADINTGDLWFDLSVYVGEPPQARALSVRMREDAAPEIWAAQLRLLADKIDAEA